MSFDHLLPEAANAVLMSREDRIDFVLKDRWIGYDAATKFTKEVADLVRHPRNLRMPCRALVGDPQNGKSSLLSQCSNLYPRVDSRTEQSHLAILIFEMPSAPDEGRLYSQILKALFIAHREDAAPEKLLAKVIEQCVDLNIRVLMADEFHNMLCGTPAHQRQLLASLKSLVNILRVSFVAAGVQEIGRALAADGQFMTRFEKFTLPRWGINEESRSLLASLEQIMPLAKPSLLANDPDLAIAILASATGTIGSICEIVRKSAKVAIEDKTEQITKKIVDKVVNDIREHALAA